MTTTKLRAPAEDPQIAGGRPVTPPASHLGRRRAGMVTGGRPASDLHIVAALGRVTRDLRLVEPDKVSTGGGTSPAVTGGTSPKPGSMPWIRVFYDRRIARGALVEHDGRAAHILSASKGFLYLREWRSGQRVGVRPYEISFPAT